MSIRELQSQVRDICKQQGVKRLDLFGSRAHSLNELGNDYDFVAEIPQSSPAEYSICFFRLLHALEDTLGAPVDLLTYDSISKASLRNEIERDRVTIYEG